VSEKRWLSAQACKVTVEEKERRWCDSLQPVPSEDADARGMIVCGVLEENATFVLQ
jgi:hypothetical protein